MQTSTRVIKTFTHKGHVASMAVTAEEIQTMLNSIKRINSQVFPKFLQTTARILWKEEQRCEDQQGSDTWEEKELSQDAQDGVFNCTSKSSALSSPSPTGKSRPSPTGKSSPSPTGKVCTRQSVSEAVNPARGDMKDH